jgi:ABC-2 type transport system permease protein
MRPELIVAGKELRDHMTSKRFLAIFAILMLLAVIGMSTGMGQYNESLDQYKKSQAENQQQQWYKEQVAALQKQIADADANGLSAEELQSLKQQLDYMVNPPMPSILNVFGGLSEGSAFGGGYFTIILMLLSIAIGFDLITREKEEGSLKSLLSHPVYRDAVINGKLLGALAVLVIVMGSTFLVTMAIMLFYSIVPTGDDLLRIIAYFVIALLYCSVFFAVAMLFSTLTKTSAMSILCVLGVIVALIVIPSFSPNIANIIVGSPPEAPSTPQGGIIMYDRANNASDSSSDGKMLPVPVKPGAPDDEWQQYYTDIQQYYQKQQMIVDAIDTVSPIYGFGSKISPAIIYKQGGDVGPILYSSAMSSVKMPGYYVNLQPTLWDSLAYVWVSILALLIEIVAPLAVSYAIFMRTDIR